MLDEKIDIAKVTLIDISYNMVRAIKEEWARVISCSDDVHYQLTKAAEALCEEKKYVQIKQGNPDS